MKWQSVYDWNLWTLSCIQGLICEVNHMWFKSMCLIFYTCNWKQKLNMIVSMTMLLGKQALPISLLLVTSYVNLDRLIDRHSCALATKIMWQVLSRNQWINVFLSSYFISMLRLKLSLQSNPAVRHIKGPDKIDLKYSKTPQ